MRTDLNRGKISLVGLRRGRQFSGARLSYSLNAYSLSTYNLSTYLQSKCLQPIYLPDPLKAVRRV